MSHNYCEQKKSKYIYSNIETTNPIYLFVITITTNDSQINIRKIKHSKNDSIINMEDSINYNNIKKIKIEVVNIDNPKNIITIKSNINTNKSSNYIFNENIRVSINKILLDNTECNYQII